MNKVIHLKIASILLFWFGVVVTFIIWVGLLAQYLAHGHIIQFTPSGHLFANFDTLGFTWTAFAHIAHIVSGYLLARGKTTGIILSTLVALWETVGFILLFQDVIFSPTGIPIRILFVVIIYLIVSGRKELTSLQLENWRPWKNPKTVDKSKQQKQI